MTKFCVLAILSTIAVAGSSGKAAELNSLRPVRVSKNHRQAPASAVLPLTKVTAAVSAPPTLIEPTVSAKTEQLINAAPPILQVRFSCSNNIPNLNSGHFSYLLPDGKSLELESRLQVNFFINHGSVSFMHENANIVNLGQMNEIQKCKNVGSEGFSEGNLVVLAEGSTLHQFVKAGSNSCRAFGAGLAGFTRQDVHGVALSDPEGNVHFTVEQGISRFFLTLKECESNPVE